MADALSSRNTPEAVDALEIGAFSDSPFCYECGYDLSGLELPHRCPECGLLADPPRQSQAVNGWYAGWQSWLWCVTRPSRTPRGLSYVPYTPESMGSSRRRLLLLLWLPSLLAFLIVLIGACYSVQYDVKVWYYEKSDPQRTPVRTVYPNETDHFYNLNLHLFRDGLFFKQPANWRRVDERTPKHTSFSWPPDIDFMTIIFGSSPLIFLLTGYMLCRFIVSRFARRAAVRINRPEIASSTKHAVALVAFPAGAALWSWLSFIVVIGIYQAGGSDDSLWEWLGIVLFCLAAGLWMYSGLVGWALLIAADAARKIFPARKTICVLLAAVHVGAPIAVLSLILQLIW